MPVVSGWVEPQLPEWRGRFLCGVGHAIMLEYASEYPAAYALLLLPLYVGAGRIKNQAHWQTDVVAGWAVGAASGWYAHSRDTPIMIELLPHGFRVGFKSSSEPTSWMANHASTCCRG